MVKPAASLFFLASTAGLLFGIEARDLKTGNNLPSRRSSHVEVAHRFAARLTDDNAHSVHTNLVSEAKDEDEGSITTDVYGPPLDGQTGILSKDPNLHILQQQQQSKRQATSTLLPSRNAKCSNLRIPAFDSSLVDKVKSNLAATGGDSWVSGTR